LGIVLLETPFTLSLFPEDSVTSQEYFCVQPGLAVDEGDTRAQRRVAAGHKELDTMTKKHDELDLDRRGFLKCMAWVGTGAMWTLTGGVLRGTPIEQAARGDVGHSAGMGGIRFVQISDSHIGFDKPANADVTGTLRDAVAKIKAAPEQPSFVLHTGDLTHLSKPSEFDTLQQVLSELSLPVFYVPGEHDVLEDDGRSYLQRFGKGTQGAGWYSFDQGGVHFIGLVNVVNLKAGGLGTLGDEQLEWLENDVKRLNSSTAIVVFAHIPLWSVFPEWGWGTDDSARAFSYLKRFGSVSVLNGHIHQVMQKVEGHVTFHTAMSTAFPQPAPGSAPSPGPMKVEADRLKKVLDGHRPRLLHSEAEDRHADSERRQPGHC
jgi:3',5'-cyclic-AMP phosphodiesterase